MRILEFGRGNDRSLLLLQPSCVRWDIFEGLIRELEGTYHLIVPVMPGYDEENPASDFTGVEEISGKIEDWMLARGFVEIEGVYGQSMGGAFALYLAANRKVRFRHIVMDGGITPYQLPKCLTVFIALRDFVMVELARLVGPKALSFMFDPEKYSGDDLKYASDVLRSMSARTVMNTFWSCNNYRLPATGDAVPGRMRYLYGEGERAERKWDLDVIRSGFPQAEIEEIPGVSHGEMLALQPAALAEKLRTILAGG